ncbi:MAG: hypothetical protein IKL23_02545 [Oscillospiraceae bacterium]|nr:hypothetical protein [Oscillospiraceae bacterium]
MQQRTDHALIRNIIQIEIAVVLSQAFAVVNGLEGGICKGTDYLQTYKVIAPAAKVQQELFIVYVPPLRRGTTAQ